MPRFFGKNACMLWGCGKVFGRPVQLQASGDEKAMQKSVSHKGDFSHSYPERKMSEIEPNVPRRLK